MPPHTNHSQLHGLVCLFHWLGVAPPLRFGPLFTLTHKSNRLRYGLMDLPLLLSISLILSWYQSSLSLSGVVWLWGLFGLRGERAGVEESRVELVEYIFFVKSPWESDCEYIFLVSLFVWFISKQKCFGQVWVVGCVTMWFGTMY